MEGCLGGARVPGLEPSRDLAGRLLTKLASLGPQDLQGRSLSAPWGQLSLPQPSSPRFGKLPFLSGDAWPLFILRVLLNVLQTLGGGDGGGEGVA